MDVKKMQQAVEVLRKHGISPQVMEISKTKKDWPMLGDFILASRKIGLGVRVRSESGDVYDIG